MSFYYVNLIYIFLFVLFFKGDFCCDVGKVDFVNGNMVIWWKLFKRK